MATVQLQAIVSKLQDIGCKLQHVQMNNQPIKTSLKPKYVVCSEISKESTPNNTNNENDDNTKEDSLNEAKVQEQQEFERLSSELASLSTKIRRQSTHFRNLSTQKNVEEEYTKELENLSASLAESTQLNLDLATEFSIKSNLPTINDDTTCMEDTLVKAKEHLVVLENEKVASQNAKRQELLDKKSELECAIAAENLSDRPLPISSTNNVVTDEEHEQKLSEIREAGSVAEKNAESIASVLPALFRVFAPNHEIGTVMTRIYTSLLEGETVDVKTMTTSKTDMAAITELQMLDLVSYRDNKQLVILQ